MLEFYKEISKSFIDRYPHHILHPNSLYHSVVLDIGAGFCNDKDFALRRCDAYIALDLHIYSSQADVQAKSAQLPFENKTFDIVILNNVIHCLPQHEILPTLLETNRVCRGKLVGRTLLEEKRSASTKSYPPFITKTAQAITDGKLIPISRNTILTMAGLAGFTSCITHVKRNTRQEKPFHVFYFSMDTL